MDGVKRNVPFSLDLSSDAASRGERHCTAGGVQGYKGAPPSGPDLTVTIWLRIRLRQGHTMGEKETEIGRICGLGPMRCMDNRGQRCTPDHGDIVLQKDKKKEKKKKMELGVR